MGGGNLLLPKYKGRNVSAVRDFPKGLKRLPGFVDLKSTSGRACGLQDEYFKATGHDKLNCHSQIQEVDRIVDVEEDRVLQVDIKKQSDVAVEELIRNNPKRLQKLPENIDFKTPLVEPCGLKNAKEFKKSSKEVDQKVKTAEACGSQNAKEFKKSSEELDKKVKTAEARGSQNAKEFKTSSEELDNKVKTAEARGSQNAKEFKKSSEELDKKVKTAEARGSQNAKEFKKFLEELDQKVKTAEACKSKNAKEFKKSSEELDPKLKGEETHGLINKSLKPIELYEASIDSEREVNYEKGLFQLGIKKQCGNGDNNRVVELKKNLSCQKFGDFSYSVKPVVDGGKCSREKKQPDSKPKADLSCLQNGTGRKEIIEGQDNATSFNSCNQPGNLHRTFPKRRKVSAIRDFPPALVRIIPLNPRHRNTEVSDGQPNNLLPIGSGYEKSEKVGECFQTDVENEKDLDFLKTDDFSHSKAKDRKESSFNSGQELLLDKVVSTEQLGMGENSYSDFVRSSDGANILAPKCGINNVETAVENRFLINDEPCLDMENQEFRYPNGHNSPATNDVQESRYQQDDMFSLAPVDVADFFSDDCHNGFLFEDGEPSETNSQSAWQDGSEEILKTAHNIVTMDHGIKAIAGSGDDVQRLQLNDSRNEPSKTNKLSISGKEKEDESSLFNLQKNPSCRNSHGFSQQRFPSVGGSVARDNATKYQMGTSQAKKVPREVIKLEGGGSKVGKLKYMPKKEACKALEKQKHNNLLSVKIYKKPPMSRASENIGGVRVVVQGLMAAKRCPWRQSQK